MVRSSLVNMVAMVAGASLSFGLVVLVSRWLQPRGAGAFFELIALFTILSNTLELGADTGLTRWISRARAIGGLADVRCVVAIAVIPVGLVSAAAAAVVWAGAPQIAAFFLHGLTPGAGVSDVRIIAPLIPLGALSACIVDGARGFGRMWPYLAIEGVGKPAARIALVVAVLAVRFGLHAAIVAWGIPVAAGLAVGCVIFSQLLRKEAPRPAPSRRRRATRRVTVSAGSGPGAACLSSDPRQHRGQHCGPWRPVSGRVRQLAAGFWGFTGPRAFQATFQVVILWLDILLVGAIASSYQAGVYGAVSKLAIVGTFLLEGNRLAIAPQLSALLARHQNERAAGLYQNATRWLVLASWPLYLVFAVFPATVLGMFGSRYTAGAAALAVLSLAMLVNLGTGNVTVVLLMGGKSVWSAANAAAALAVNIGLNLWLIPRLGILGAAIAWAASIVVDNVTAMVEVHWILGLALFGRGYWVAASATVGCFGATGAAARMLLGQNLPALAAGLAVGLGLFGIALYLARRQLELTTLVEVLRPRPVRVPAVSTQQGKIQPT